MDRDKENNKCNHYTCNLSETKLGYTVKIQKPHKTHGRHIPDKTLT